MLATPTVVLTPRDRRPWLHRMPRSNDAQWDLWLMEAGLKPPSVPAAAGAGAFRYREA